MVLWHVWHATLAFFCAWQFKQSSFSTRKPLTDTAALWRTPLWQSSQATFLARWVWCEKLTSSDSLVTCVHCALLSATKGFKFFSTFSSVSWQFLHTAMLGIPARSPSVA